MENINDEILDILLTDRTLNQKFFDNDYAENIKARYEKTKEEKQKRTKNKAEVFTPSWICNKQINMVDNEWLQYENAFNFEDDKSWHINTNKIDFSKCGKDYLDYLRSTRLEVTCGEAPYLVSRYNTVNGEYINVPDRIGMLDRKLRVAKENSICEQDYIINLLESYNNIYGYEYQKDNLFLARKNLFLTFIENYLYCFNKMPSDNLQNEIADLISWHIVNMDGLKCTIPETDIECLIKTPLGEIIKFKNIGGVK